ncbi:MAG TPA: hypothetical protein VKD71_16060 [Gemmataceae bacterium]|nr:hypothetical protein [Gemmataceae bacterium]
MRSLLSLCLSLVAFAAAHAQTKDPLRFLPESTDVVLKIEKPRALVDAIVHHDLAKQAQELQFVREFLDSADARRFFRLVAYFEKELGAPWPELIDKLAGGGIAAGVKYGGQNAPFLLVLQGTDEKTVARFFDLSLSLFEEEAARQGAKEKPKRKSYEGVEGIELDKNLLVARAGDAILVANKSESLKAGIDQYVATGKHAKAKSIATSSASKDIAGILPPNPAAWLWLNLKPVKEMPELKDLFKTPRDNVALTVIAAGYLDVARRSDFIAAGLYHDAGDFRVAVRLPAGRDGMATDVELHLPRDPNVGGTLPLLEPKGVLFSHSFYLDLDTLYQKRDEIMPPTVAKQFAEGEKQISRFLINTTLPKFLSQAGVHYRLVAVQPEKVADYKTEPNQPIPAFAAVLSMRDPAFVKSMNALVKAGALALASQASVRSWEEEIAGVPAFGYSFPEDGKFPDDPLKARFNFQPTFAAVKDQYILASNKGLCRELIGILEKEDRTKLASQNMRMRVYASSIGNYASVSPEQSLASIVIAQALKLGDARQQTDVLFAYLQKLGSVQLETDYTPVQFRFDLYWKTRK